MRRTAANVRLLFTISAKISEVAWRPNAFRSLENEDDEVCFVSLHDGRCKVVRVNEKAKAEELFDERDENKLVEETMASAINPKRDEFRCTVGLALTRSRA